MSDNRITVLMGAGATLDIQAPSTKDLTQAVKDLAKSPKVRFERQEIIKHIFSTLENFCPRSETNFEDVFHAIEQLISVKGARNPDVIRGFKPILTAFLEDGDWLKSTEPTHLYSLIHLIRKTIGDHLYKVCNEFGEQPKANWFKDFWLQLGRRFDLDIATLNYDNFFEQIFDNNDITDGYSNNTQSPSSFSTFTLGTAKKHKLLHLHGSILFGKLHPRHRNLLQIDNPFHSLLKFDSYEAATEGWEVDAGENYAQSGEQAANGPIITGLRKPDKLLISPYIDYSHQFFDSLSKNKNLLIIGYGFGDFHINALLNRMRAWHGNKRKIVLIDYIDSFHRATWSPFNRHFDWVPKGLFPFFNNSIGQSQPFRPHGYLNPAPLGSDNAGLMFLEGFKEASTHLNEIVDFFSNE